MEVQLKCRTDLFFLDNGEYVVSVQTLIIGHFTLKFHLQALNKDLQYCAALVLMHVN